MEERALVSEIPGTTRDVIEDTIVIDGIEYRFIDTAGLRETADVIENMGIRKTHEKIDQASVVLLVDEVNDTPEAINKRADNIRLVGGSSGKKLIMIINKSDLSTDNDIDTLRKAIKTKPGETLLFISAKGKNGINELKNILGQIVEKERLRSDDVIITNIRHYEALSHITDSLVRVEEGLSSGIPEDLVAIDIRQAIHYLGEITGEITNDEILGNIFKNFCIGK
jgi:tRNA modification GTPase